MLGLVLLTLGLFAGLWVGTPTLNDDAIVRQVGRGYAVAAVFLVSLHLGLGKCFLGTGLAWPRWLLLAVAIAGSQVVSEGFARLLGQARPVWMSMVVQIAFVAAGAVGLAMLGASFLAMAEAIFAGLCALAMGLGAFVERRLGRLAGPRLSPATRRCAHIGSRYRGPAATAQRRWAPPVRWPCRSGWAGSAGAARSDR